MKTGTTNEAGPCLVASGTINGRQIICVVLNSENRWSDSTKLLNYGFNNFESCQVLEKGEAVSGIAVKDGCAQEVRAIAAQEYLAVIPKGRTDLIEKKLDIENTLDAPIFKGQPVGSVHISVNGRYTGSADLVSDRDVKRKNILRILSGKNLSGWQPLHKSRG
ncbi:MAG: D-alanyl-D-alanine carboxypeptidase DacA precursor [Firmicutes bacterium ADurb.Bin373]|nr:MAG: D-alanyl-D-alanine carboxypeptidase DacA precursor [Firmicutes bacterium ADurb.Bin373]